LAIDRHDQCVASFGFECWVNSTISAIFSSLIDGLRPRPSATSPNPASPSSSNCARHASTVGRDTPATSLISEFDTPSAADNNTRARQLIEVAIGPGFSKRDGIRVRRHPSVMSRAAPPHVLDVEEALDPRVHRLLIGVGIALDRLVRVIGQPQGDRS